MSTSPVGKLESDLTADEQQLITELRALAGNVQTDAAQIVADGKVAGSSLYTALAAVLKSA
jgi:hypothetical protein